MAVLKSGGKVHLPISLSSSNYKSEFFLGSLTFSQLMQLTIPENIGGLIIGLSIIVDVMPHDDSIGLPADLGNNRRQCRSRLNLFSAYPTRTYHTKSQTNKQNE